MIDFLRAVGLRELYVFVRPDDDGRQDVMMVRPRGSDSFVPLLGRDRAAVQRLVPLAPCTCRAGRTASCGSPAART